MFRRTLPLVRAAAAGFLLLAGGRLSAQLAANSPFQPVPSSVPTAPAADAQIKYGGFIQTSDGILYRLTDSTRKAAAFVKLNQRDDVLGVTVKQHDPQSNTVTVDFGGRTLTLAEPKAKIVSNGVMPGPVPAPMPAGVPPPVATNMSPAVTATVVANPTAQDEQKRLDAVAAEVARRRAMREQAATGGAGQPVPPQPVGAQPVR